MKKLDLNLSNNGIGSFIHDCKVTIENKMDGVHISIHECKYPNLINSNLIEWLMNRQSDLYDSYVTQYNKKEIASNGWLNDEIVRLESRIEHLKFIQKLAKRNKIITHDLTKD